MTIFIFILFLIIIIEGFIIYMLARKPKPKYVPTQDIALKNLEAKEKENAETIKHIEKIKAAKNISRDAVIDVLDSIKL